MPPIPPMLAKPVPSIPDVGHFEPKWDGFRTIVFKDGDEIILGSRNERPMTRYFPELVDALRLNLPPKCVVDGEIVLISGTRLDFEGLQQRIHPAESRVRLLAKNTPASFIAFDILALDEQNLMDRPFAERRAALEGALAGAKAPIFVTPAVQELSRAQEWFTLLEGAGLDGVLSKPLDGTYQPNKRVMFKTKHERTADCVVAGFRWHKTAKVVGSMLLGLYDDAGRLQHVGVVASFPMARRQSLVVELEPYQTELGEHPWGDWGSPTPGSSGGSGSAAGGSAPASRMPGGPSRWSAGKDFSFVPLRPELVVEVAYDFMEGDRFRHTTQFRRWRPDREPESCTYAQLEESADYDLGEILPLR